MYCNYLLLIGLLVIFGGTSDAREAIVNGGLAAVNQYPYHVAVNVFRQGYICGGGILSLSHVLTAAHCVVKANGKFVIGAFVLAGTNDFEQAAIPAQTGIVTKIYVPREYRPLLPSRIADIAVLRLRKPFQMHYPMRVLSFLRLPEDDKDDYFDKNGTITGFGWDWVAMNDNEVTGGNAETQLRHAEATVMSKSQCQHNRHLPFINEKHLCARIAQHSNATHGVCVRDGGGPLVFQGTVIGILSQNPRDCSERRTPGIYTRVSSFIDFITDAVSDKKNKQTRECHYHPDI